MKRVIVAASLVGAALCLALAYLRTGQRLMIRGKQCSRSTW